ncbi:MAG: hypothetical protein ACKO3G_00335 [Planctomycetaceae bacterium]
MLRTRDRLVRSGEHLIHGLLPATGEPAMGKGNNAQKNDKKKMKPKQDKTKPAAKK